jgi:predicted Fe-Mo cluster-binding NifX family protein
MADLNKWRGVCLLSQASIVKIAIPRHGEFVAPCFEWSATITIFTVRGKHVVDQTDFSLQSQDPVDRVRLLRDQGVDTLVCGGLQDSFEDLVAANGIRVFSWVAGRVEDLIRRLLDGRLTSGGTPGCRGCPPRSQGRDQ